MKPSIARNVILNLTDEQCALLGGNHAAGSKQAPAIIVSVWGNAETSAVNLKVFGDSDKSLWVTSAMQGEKPGQWQAPPRIEEAKAEVAEVVVDEVSNAKVEELSTADSSKGIAASHTGNQQQKGSGKK